MCRRLCGVLSLALTLTTTLACTVTDDTPPGLDAQGSVDVPVVADNGAPIDAGTTDIAAVDVPIPTTLEEIPADHDVTVAGLDGPVRIYRDEYGVPHVYATTAPDAYFGQGFVTAMDRLIQIHLYRMAASGRYAELPLQGPGELAGDVYMRTIDLRGVAEEIWAAIEASGDEDTITVLESYAAGVNAYLAALRDGSLPTPGLIQVMGVLDQVQDWTPVDSLTIGRLQSWDLSFDGYMSELDVTEIFLDLTERFPDGPLAGLVDDVLHFNSYTPTTVLEGPPERKAASASPSYRELVRQPFYEGLRQSHVPELRAHVRQLRALTRRISSDLDFGSNSWAVSGEHTKSGAAILSNDTHLSLSNPAVFYQNHLTTLHAGGDLDIAGVSFPGIPAMILGRNRHVAWAATVFPADVNDMYKELIHPDDDGAVVFNGEAVAIENREEVLTYPPPTGGCAAMLASWTDNYDYELTETETLCTVTLQVPYVPHHGPVIPGSRVTAEDGTKSLMTWKWTGFEPSEDIQAVLGYNASADIDEFLEHTTHFGVGNQNWLAVDSDGNIGYRAFVKLPERPWLEGEGTAYPPWLPLPGTGQAEWGDWVAPEHMPVAKNPEEGYLVGCNNDVWGVTMDGDPTNDGEPYHSFLFDIGFRAARVDERVRAQIAAGGDFTVATMQSIQADHRSSLGSLLTPTLLEALAAVEAGTADCDGCEFTTAIGDARDRLAAWSYEAAAGTDEDATQDQIDDSIATSIFNVWLTKLSDNVLDDKGLGGISDNLKGRLLLRMLLAPEELATWDEGRSDTILWDDLSTEAVEEGRSFVIFKSFVEALAFLADPAKVGPANAGGFGTEDMSQWRWGELHRIKSPYPLGGDMPSDPALVDGYKRPGDRYCVDACHPRIGSDYYGYSSGPAIRAVFHMNSDGLEHECVIPGGQTGLPYTKHYEDEMARWAANEAHPIFATDETLFPSVEEVLILRP